MLTSRCNTLAKQLNKRPIIRTLTIQQNLHMRQSLPVQNESLASLHRIVDVEVLHAQDVFVDVERAEVPANTTTH